MTLKQAAQTALEVQNGCNVAGIALAMVEAIRAIRADPTVITSANTHPIVTLFLLKMCELNGCGSSLHKTYEPAEKACEELARRTDALVACSELARGGDDESGR